MSEMSEMGKVFQNHMEKELEIKTLFGSIERGFENDFENGNLKFAMPQGLVSSLKNKNSTTKRDHKIHNRGVLSQLHCGFLSKTRDRIDSRRRETS